MGESSNNPVRSWWGDDVVKLSTIDGAGPEIFRGVFAVPSDAANAAAKWRPSLGDSGEKDGNEVSDLSEGLIEEAELEVYEEYFRGLDRTVCDRWLRIDVFELWDGVL